MTAGCNCGRKWVGLSQAHCPTCHEHFGSVAGFDRHRGNGHCRPPADIRRGDGTTFFKATFNSYGCTWAEDDPRGHYRGAADRGKAIQ
jgi:hypothetical protein